MSDLDFRALGGQALTEDEFVKQSTEHCSNLGGVTHSGTHSTRPPESNAGGRDDRQAEYRLANKEYLEMLRDLRCRQAA